MTIRQKLIALLITAIAAILIIGGVGLHSISTMQARVMYIGGNSLPTLVALLTAHEQVIRLSRSNYMLLSTDPAMPLNDKTQLFNNALQTKQTAWTTLDQNVKQYESLPFMPGEAEAWVEGKRALDIWRDADKKVTVEAEKFLASPSEDSFRVFLERGRAQAAERGKIIRQLDERLKVNIDINLKLSDEAVREANQTAAAMLNISIALFIVSIVMLIVLGLFILRSIMRPIQLSLSVLSDITRDSDLTRRIDYHQKDEIGGMVIALNGMLEKMQASLRLIQQNMEKTHALVGELKTTADEVESSSAHQNSASSSMAAAVEEMTVSINTVSDNANQARQLAGESEQISISGGNIIRQTTTEMENIATAVSGAAQVVGELGEASKQISSVVQVIKEVADQTNLLALNAAIEAARAGEQGRGFAVVADEVRKLAERTTNSTNEISGMVEKIQLASDNSVQEMQKVVEQMHSGQSLAREAGECIKQIHDAAKRVTAVVAEISTALKEQSVASNDVAKNVEKIAQMTDQNHAAAGSVAENTHHLGDLAAAVVGTIRTFRV